MLWLPILLVCLCQTGQMMGQVVRLILLGKLPGMQLLQLRLGQRQVGVVVAVGVVAVGVVVVAVVVAVTVVAVVAVAVVAEDFLLQDLLQLHLLHQMGEILLERHLARQRYVEMYPVVLRHFSIARVLFYPHLGKVLAGVMAVMAGVVAVVILAVAEVHNRKSKS